jgi:hypothetical protein
MGLHAWSIVCGVEIRPTVMAVVEVKYDLFSVQV